MDNPNNKRFNELTEGFRKEIMEVVIKNRCWWDMKICPYYSDIKGFQEAGTFCSGCNRIDPKKFIGLLKELTLTICLEESAREILSIEIEDLKEESEEKGKKIGREEARKEFYQKFHDEIERIIASLKNFISE